MTINDLKVGDIVEAKIGLSDWMEITIKRIEPDRIVVDIPSYCTYNAGYHVNHFKALRRITIH